VAALAGAVRAAFGALDVAWGDAARLRYDAVDLPAVGGPGDPFGVFRVVYSAPDQDGRQRPTATPRSRAHPTSATSWRSSPALMGHLQDFAARRERVETALS
jgi:hypothetical protein